jgi:hypothetical protein
MRSLITSNVKMSWEEFWTIALYVDTFALVFVMGYAVGVGLK